MPDGPKVGKDRFEEGLFEKLDTEAAAGTFLVADCSLNNFHMPVSPFLLALVEVGHQLEKNRYIGLRLVKAKQEFLDTVIGPC